MLASCPSSMARLSLLSRSLEDVVDVIARIRLVGVLHSEPRLLSSGKEVLVLVVLIVVVVIVIVMSVSMSSSSATRRQVLERPQPRNASLLRRLSLCGLLPRGRRRRRRLGRRHICASKSAAAAGDGLLGLGWGSVCWLVVACHFRV